MQCRIVKCVKTRDDRQVLPTRHWLPSDLPIVHHFLQCVADIMCADAVTEAFFDNHCCPRLRSGFPVTACNDTCRQPLSNSTRLLNNTLWEQIGIQPGMTRMQILMLQLRPSALSEARLGALNTRSDRRASTSVHLTHLPLAASRHPQNCLERGRQPDGAMRPCADTLETTDSRRSRKQMQTAKRLGMSLPFLMSGCHLGLKASQDQVKRWQSSFVSKSDACSEHAAEC